MSTEVGIQGRVSRGHLWRIWLAVPPVYPCRTRYVRTPASGQAHRARCEPESAATGGPRPRHLDLAAAAGASEVRLGRHQCPVLVSRLDADVVTVVGRRSGSRRSADAESGPAPDGPVCLCWSAGPVPSASGGGSGWWGRCL